MKKYERPMVLVNEEMSEGVYAASGECFLLQNAWEPYNEYGTIHYKLGANLNYDQPGMWHTNENWTALATVDGVTIDVKVLGTGIVCTKAECGNKEITIEGITPTTDGAIIRICIPGASINATGGFDFQLYVDSTTPASINSISVACEHHF